jgi:hypothetical protein
MNRVLLVVCALFGTLFAASASQAGPQCDAATVIQRSVQANAEDWNAARQYDYFERDGDPKGGSKTYEVLMILGSPYQRLVAVNGEPLPPELQAKEERKLQAAILQRKEESPQERDRRIAKYEQERKRDHLLPDQMTKALDFQVVGEQQLGSSEVCVLKATPHPGFEPSSREAKVLTGMEGTLWIDTKTFQWVKVEAYVIHPVSIEGFLARVDPGTRFELEKMPVADNIRLLKHFEMKSQAKILFFFTRKTQANETYYGYHKATSTKEGLAEN